MRAPVLDDDDADRRAFVDRLDDIGRLKHVALGRLVPADGQPLGHRHARRRQHDFGRVLLHGEGRGEHAGMRVGDAQHLENALNGPVLADPPMQRVKGDVGFQLRQLGGDVARDIDFRDLETFGAQGPGAAGARAQRNLALSRPAAHQDGDMLCHVRGPDRFGVRSFRAWLF